MQDARAGETVAAVAETGRESELFGIVSRIGSRLRNRLGVTELSASQVASVEASLPSNPAAARMYAEGLAQLRLYDAQAARRSLEQAVNADPKLPLAHSALALAWSALGYDERAQQSAKRAYELSASLAREDRMWVEGRYHDAMNEHARGDQDLPGALQLLSRQPRVRAATRLGSNVGRQGTRCARDD